MYSDMLACLNPQPDNSILQKSLVWDMRFCERPQVGDQLVFAEEYLQLD